MNSYGIIRKVDSLGKITIPSEFRKHLDIAPGDYLQITMRDDEVVYKKYLPDEESISTHLSALKTYAMREKDPAKQEKILAKIEILESLLIKMPVI